MLHLEKGGGRELKGRLGTSWTGGQLKLNLSGLRKTSQQQMAQNTREQIKQVIQQSQDQPGPEKASDRPSPGFWRAPWGGIAGL